MRPIGVTIVCLIGWIYAVFYAFFAAQIAFRSFGTGPFDFLILIFLFTWSIIISIMYFGLWKMKKAAWKGVIALQTIGLMYGLIDASSLGYKGIIGVVISATILFYLWKERGLFT
jgi:hypothetical protein